MVVQHNMSADNASRQYGIVTSEKSKSMEKLSSGYRINRAADDAAGLTISESMRYMIRGLNKASKNAQDGVSFIQVADGALGEMHSVLDRCKELTTQAANDTNTDSDRAAIQRELDELCKEIDRISTDTKFNTIDVFSKQGLKPDSAANVGNAGNANVIKIEWSFVGSDGNTVALDDAQAVGRDNSYANSDMAKFVKKAAEDAVASLQSAYPTMFANGSSSSIKVGLNIANIDGKGNTLASAALSMQGSSNYTLMGYTLNIDSSDYPLNSFSSMSADKKADLAATIAHEMTHLVMYDTVTNGMLSGRTGSFPKWFVEGMAQTSSGDNGWVSQQIDQNSSDSEIKSYMGKMSTMPYGAGYLATMYLGYAAQDNGTGTTPVSSANIKSGLDKILGDIAGGKTLDQAIKDNTKFTGLSDFQNKFSGADTSSLNFVKGLLAARGSGAGSLLATNLSETEASAFAEGNLTGTSGNYTIQTDNSKYMNAFGSGYTFPPKAQGAVDDGGSLILQVGALEGQGVSLNRYDVSADAIFGGGALDVTNHISAGNSMTLVDSAIEKVSGVRTYYGAIQNRLEHTIMNLDNTSENTQAAESRIRDVDMAEEMVKMSKSSILAQVGEAMIAQTNQVNQGVLSLLQ